jgi:histidyl-tRNA synthetase
LGVATVDEENFVHLVSDAFIPNEGMEEMAYYLGHNLHDHAQAAVSNMQGQQPAFFERCVHYDELSIESVQQITKLSKKIGMKSLQEMYKTTDRIAKAQPADVKQNMRLTYGIYYYHEPMQSIKGKADDE